MSVKSQVTGTVVSDKMQKTVVVAVERQVRHGLYGKIQRKTSTFVAHNEDDTAKRAIRSPAQSAALSRPERWVVTRWWQGAGRLASDGKETTMIQMRSILDGTTIGRGRSGDSTDRWIDRGYTRGWATSSRI